MTTKAILAHNGSSTTPDDDARRAGDSKEHNEESDVSTDAGCIDIDL
jgi:hypothetical protein